MQWQLAQCTAAYKQNSLVSYEATGIMYYASCLCEIDYSTFGHCT